MCDGGPSDSELEWRTKPEYTIDENENLTPVPPEPDIGLLDICVARIIDVTPHPRHYETFYIQTLDTGRYSRKRKAISLFGQDYKPTELLGRLVLTVLNVRPLHSRDLVKRFLLMCAQHRRTGRVELLDPPPGSVEGDAVFVEGFRREPLDEISLGKYERKSTKHYFLPYKKWNDTFHCEDFDETKSMFDSTASELWVSKEKVAEFMGLPLQVEGKGVVTSRTLKNCPVVFE